jgi:hypothetical protein
MFISLITCVIWINDWIAWVQCDENKSWHEGSLSDVWLTVLTMCINTVYEFYFCFISFPFNIIVFIYKCVVWFCHKSLGCGKTKMEARRGCVTFLFDDVPQFTGCSRLLLLCHLWLQTPPRSSCLCYHQHDWVTQQLLHLPIRKLGSTHRSIATRPPHPSRSSVRPKISVPTVAHRLSKKTTFNQQPSVTTTITTTP